MYKFNPGGRKWKICGRVGTSTLSWGCPWLYWMLKSISGFSTKEISNSLHPLQLWASKMSTNAPQGKNHSKLRTNDLYQLLVVLYLRLLCPWNSSGKNTGASSHSLLQGIFPTQGSNLGLLHCRQILYCLSHQRGPIYGKEHDKWKRMVNWSFNSHKIVIVILRLSSCITHVIFNNWQKHWISPWILKVTINWSSFCLYKHIVVW